MEVATQEMEEEEVGWELLWVQQPSSQCNYHSMSCQSRWLPYTAPPLNFIMIKPLVQGQSATKWPQPDF